MKAIQIENLTKRYGRFTAVDRLNLEVEAGELFSLLGVNGAGKSTTIKMLSGMARPTEGDAFLLGKSIRTDLAGVKSLIGVSPQETAVAQRLTVEENLRFMAGIYGFSKEKAREKLEEMVARFSLGEVLKKRAGTLSGGFQRRLSIAMALFGEPKILFLDEPTLGLDVITRSELWDTIRALKESVTVVLTTHYMEEAEALSDRVGIMAGGRCIALGTPEELKRKVGAASLEAAFLTLVKEAKQ